MTTVGQRLREHANRRAIRLARRVDRLEAATAATRRRVRAMVSLDHHVRARPLAVLALAAGAGYALGRLLP